MKRLTPGLLLALVLCAAAAGAKALKGRGLFTGAPGMNAAPTAEPGTTKPLALPYPGAPPLIPHGIAGLSITRESNDCLGCHLEGSEVAEGHSAAKLPASHRAGDGVKGVRYQCRQCHVPQDTAARPPVAQAP